jgi:hypothetical protein
MAWGSTLSRWQIQDEDGMIPQPLPILRICFKRPVPHHYQTENRLVESGITWNTAGRVPKYCLPELCDSVSSLWVNGDSGGNGYNDRMGLAHHKLSQRIGGNHATSLIHNAQSVPYGENLKASPISFGINYVYWGDVLGGRS